jgi:AraC family transcriptional regulator
MSDAKPLRVDFSQEYATAPLVPNSPLLTSYEAEWKGIHLAHHHQPSWELPELSGSQHTIVLPIVKQTTSVEFGSYSK